jgi:hypothetical protein
MIFQTKKRCKTLQTLHDPSGKLETRFGTTRCFSNSRPAAYSSAMLLPIATAEGFAASTLANVVREYPNKMDHVFMGPEDVKSPRELHPIFFGSFDWHSCVHGYWQLARLHRLVPNLAPRAAIERQLTMAFTEPNVVAELAYMQKPANRGFERPYGWAWLLMLCHELSLHDHDLGRRWHRSLQPLGDLVANRFLEFLPKAGYAIRSGTHANTAFAMTLALEYARSKPNQELTDLLIAKAREWFWNDASCPVWEPSGNDFLSPALTEAICMSQSLSSTEFHKWFASFLPNLVQGEPATLFIPATPSDRTDGQIAHLDGLNLSRAWCFNAIANTFEAANPMATLLRSAAQKHLDASLPHVFGDYAGEHWLATFALLAIS